MCDGNNPYHYLSTKDKVFSTLISRYGELKLSNKGSILYGLLTAVINQQLSQQSAEAIEKRVISLIGKGTKMSNNIIEVKEQGLQQCGLSSAKAKTIVGLARLETEGKLKKTILNKMTDENITEYLTSIWGIGPWTAQIVLMFTLAREDVMPITDGGIIRSFNNLYKNRKIENVSKKWKPYRSYASLYLWKSLDSKDSKTK